MYGRRKAQARQRVKKVKMPAVNPSMPNSPERPSGRILPEEGI